MSFTCKNIKSTVRRIALTLSLIVASSAMAEEVGGVSASIIVAAPDTASTSFRELGLVGYLQGLCDYTVYEGNHQGRWSEGDQLIFSIGGNSYRQNRYYLDGFRIDNRFTSGSTLYAALYANHNLQITPEETALHFVSRSTEEYVRLTGNVGNVGGINPTTEGIIHLFHGTGSEDMYHREGITKRQHTRGAGTIDALFHTRRGQHEIIGTFGNRQLPQYDQNGLLTTAPLYGANYYKLQAIGRLQTAGYFDHVGYLANISGKDDGFSEFYYNRNEQPRLATYSASVYAERSAGPNALTTGLTWTTTTFRHDDVAFSRNLIDQDGESLEPWMPDGSMHELSWSAQGKKFFGRSPLLNLWLEAKAYNSLISHVASSNGWSNDVYMQQMEEACPTPLYRYDWTSHSFVGALLENEVRFHLQRSATFLNRRASGSVSFGANLGISLDGMLMNGNSKVTPNVVGNIHCRWQPFRWLEVSAEVSHDRMTYDVETMCFMSTRYMNADILSAVDGTLLTQSGGRHHRFAKGTWQPSYLAVTIPLTLRFGRHEIALIQSYRKFYHTWITQYEGGAAANGYYVDTPLTAEILSDRYFPADGNLPMLPLYYLNPGERTYEVGYMPKDLMGSGFFTGTPYYMTQQSRYTYHGRKVEASIGWQSMMGVGYCGLGNGPGSNNVGLLSESTANPNTFLVVQNSIVDGAKGCYPAAGRYDQDRAYICRLALSWHINNHVQIGALGSWTDGQPFVYYRTFVRPSGSSGIGVSADPAQVAIVNGCSRGINPTDGNFGCRESAIFHIDLHARFQWQMMGHSTELFLQSYNVYDFGNVLNEYCFPQGFSEGRGPNMCLTIPRGIIASLKIGL